MQGIVGCGVLRLAGKESSGCVAAVFRNSAHLYVGDRVVTIGRFDIPSHPYTLKPPSFPLELRQGEKFRFSKNTISFGNGSRVSLKRLRVYTPVGKVDKTANKRDIVKTVRGAVAAALEQSVEEGIFRSLFAGLKPADIFTETMMPAAAGISRCIRSKDWNGLSKKSMQLAGLGMGLTPAGDDFLIGLLSALRFHRDNGGIENTPEESVIKRIAANAGRRTTLFSSTLLRSAAMGWYSDVVSDWLCAAHEGNSSLAESAALRILRMGHSSGADTLAGLAVAMENLLDSRQ